MELTYNFYNSLVEKNDKWSYLFQGRANEPNVILDDNGISKSFLSKKITLMPNESAEGMSLLIENEPVTNYDKKLFVRFPLEANDGVMTSLDYVLNGKSAELELNSLLPENEDVRYNENEKGIFIDFIHPLLIKSTFVRKPIVEGMTEINEMAEEQLRGLIAERLGSAVGFTAIDNDGKVIVDPSGENYEMVCDETTDGEGGNPYHMVGVNEKYNNAKEKFLLGVYFVVWVFMYMVMFFAADPMYKFINNFSNDNEAQKRFELGRKIESIVFFVILGSLFVLSITFFGLRSTGNKNSEHIFNTILFLFVFLLFCNLIIQPKKKNEEGFGIPDDYWDGASGWSNSIEEYAKYNVFTTIFSLFGSNTGQTTTSP